MSQSRYFQTEGDAWFKRNRRESANLSDHPIIEEIRLRKLAPESVLELGCSDGTLLNQICRTFSCRGSGIDLSTQAIEEGRKKYPKLDLRAGDISSLPFDTRSFDLVIFGYVLYVVDRENLFQIAAEADRVLRDKGNLIIYDRCNERPCKFRYFSESDIFVYSFDHSKMFSWSPHYQTISHRLLQFDDSSQYRHLFTKEAITTLYKNTTLDYLDIKKAKKGLE